MKNLEIKFLIITSIALTLGFILEVSFLFISLFDNWFPIYITVNLWLILAVRLLYYIFKTEILNLINDETKRKNNL